MSPTEIVIVVAAVILALVLAIAGAYLIRHLVLRRRYGPEYRRLVESEGTVAAERTLREREKQHAKLELHDLDQATKDRYRTEWTEVQARFVDAPEEAIGSAQSLVTELAAARGYPTEDHDEQVAQLSVEHSGTLQRYRSAREIYLRHQRGEATTEQLREALVHYRALFADLLGEDPINRVGGRPMPTADAGKKKEKR